MGGVKGITEGSRFNFFINDTGGDGWVAIVDAWGGHVIILGKISKHMCTLEA